MDHDDVKRWAKHNLWSNLLLIVLAVVFTIQDDALGYNVGYGEMFSVVLGLISWLIAWIPILGFVTSVPGLILGIRAIVLVPNIISVQSIMPAFGILACVVGLFFSIVSSVEGFRSGLSGTLKK